MVLFLRLLVTVFVTFAFAPLLVVAQDQKNDKKPAAEKKDAAKEDAGKDDEPKDKKAKKEKEPEEEKVVYAQVVSAKVKWIDPKSNRDFSVDIRVVDPEKVFALKQWQADQIFNIGRIQNPIDRQRALIRYQMDLAKRNNDIYKNQEVSFQATENAKIRSLLPPVEYDDKGNLKQWTAKELAALRGKTRLPGFPVEIDRLRPGQQVQLYLAKMKKSSAKPGDLDFNPEPMAPPVVMIVILQEPQIGRQ